MCIFGGRKNELFHFAKNDVKQLSAMWQTQTGTAIVSKLSTPHPRSYA